MDELDYADWRTFEEDFEGGYEDVLDVEDTVSLEQLAEEEILAEYADLIDWTIED